MQWDVNIESAVDDLHLIGLNHSMNCGGGSEIEMSVFLHNNIKDMNNNNNNSCTPLECSGLEPRLLFLVPAACKVSFSPLLPSKSKKDQY